MGFARCDLRGTPPTEIRIRLATVRPVKVVKEFSRDKTYLLSVRTRSGVPVYGSYVNPGAGQVLQLPDGNYTVDIHDGTELVRTYPITVTPSGGRIDVP